MLFFFLFFEVRNRDSEILKLEKLRQQLRESRHLHPAKSYKGADVDDRAESKVFKDLKALESQPQKAYQPHIHEVNQDNN